MAKLPYFPFNPAEYLLDNKVRRLGPYGRGLLLDLWSMMWLNQEKRGHLLEGINGHREAIPDDQIAQRLAITTDQWAEYKLLLVEKIGILKIGKYKELYSERLSKYKTEWEKRETPTQTLRNSNASRTHLNIIEYNKNIIELELNVTEDDIKRWEGLYPGKDIKALIIEADNYNRDLSPKEKKVRHRQFINNWIKNSDKFKENKNVRPYQTKRLNPSPSSDFEPPGAYSIPRAGEKAQPLKTGNQ